MELLNLNKMKKLAKAMNGKSMMKTGSVKKMGMGGMHAMPDGTMMSDKAMMPPMKKGGVKKTVKKKK